jgi:hypothetical protein
MGVKSGSKTPALQRSHVEGEGDEIGAGRWGKRRGVAAVDGAIEGVALDGNAAGGADEALEFGARRELGGFCAGIVVDLFFTTVPSRSLAPKRRAIWAMLGVSMIQ